VIANPTRTKPQGPPFSSEVTVRRGCKVSAQIAISSLAGPTGMVDIISLSVAVAALVGAAAAGIGVYIQRGQLLAAQHQLATALTQLEAERQKIDALGQLVTALTAMVEAQKMQLQAFRDSLRLQAESNEIARADAAIRAAQYQLDNRNPIDKAVESVHEVVDRGLTKAKSWWQRRRRR